LGEAAQAALDLPSAEDLFPSRGEAVAVGFADYCLRKVMLMLRSPAPRAGAEWERLRVADRVWLARLAGCKDGRGIAAQAWPDVALADRARMLAAFERLRQWITLHADFSVGVDDAEYAQQQLVLLGASSPPGRDEREVRKKFSQRR
jgi:hypothetical protein